MRRIQPPHLASRLRREDLPQAAFAGHAVEAPMQTHHRASYLRQPAPLIHAKHFRTPRLDDLGRQSHTYVAEMRSESGRCSRSPGARRRLSWKASTSNRAAARGERAAKEAGAMRSSMPGSARRRAAPRRRFRWLQARKRTRQGLRTGLQAGARTQIPSARHSQAACPAGRRQCEPDGTMRGGWPARSAIRQSRPCRAKERWECVLNRSCGTIARARRETLLGQPAFYLSSW